MKRIILLTFILLVLSGCTLLNRKKEKLMNSFNVGSSSKSLMERDKPKYDVKVKKGGVKKVKVNLGNQGPSGSDIP